ncbi:putative gustatory receptor 28a [Vespa mandarinia]|uniref:putative gustatory receptor 28a n=1 Tax=Vespa mandarinia TaxID=7446 RepID=UPI00160922DA|nr:putative gustatory receptor 28a [Vespa mandarinia]
MTYQLHVYSRYVFIIVTIVGGVFRRKKMRHIMLQIETCIRNMVIIVIDHRWLILFEDRHMRTLIFLYVEYYPFFVWLIADITFTFWIWYIKTKFSQLNELLKNMLTTTIDSPQHKRILRMWNNKKDDSSSYNIHRTEIHLELIKCAKNTNDAYGLHILISVTITFIFITTLGYDLYYFLMTEDYFVHHRRFFIFLNWIFYFGFRIIIISHLCARTITEIRGFILQLIQNPLTFTSYGFFDLDHTLIRNITGTVITYLVILIQVGKVSSNDRTKENDDSYLFKYECKLSATSNTNIIRYTAKDKI